MDRVVSQLLTEMDRLADGVDGLGIIIIGATNRPDLLDKSLLRPGRFDIKIYLTACYCSEMRLQILNATTRKFLLDEHVDLQAIAELLPKNSTGADISSMVSTAYSIAMKRRLDSLVKAALADDQCRLSSLSKSELLKLSSYMKHQSTDMSVRVSHEDFVLAAQSMRPSVSLDELDEYNDLGRLYDDSFQLEDC
jgi:peroxin-6